MAKINDDIAYPILGSLGGTVRIVIYDPVSGDPLNKVLPSTVEAAFSLNNIGGTLSVPKGGTGNTTPQAAFDALSPLASKGDLLAHNGSNNVVFATGSNGQVLFADDSQPSGHRWGNVVGVVYGSMHISTPATTVINTVNVWEKVAGTTTLGANTVGFDMPVNNQLRNISGSAKTFVFLANNSATSPTNNNIYEFAFFKNGVIVTESIQKEHYPNAGTEESVSNNWIISLDNNEYIELYVRNTTNTQNIDVEFMSMTPFVID